MTSFLNQRWLLWLVVSLLKQGWPCYCWACPSILSTGLVSCSICEHAPEDTLRLFLKTLQKLQLAQECCSKIKWWMLTTRNIFYQYLGYQFMFISRFSFLKSCVRGPSDAWEEHMKYLLGARMSPTIIIAFLVVAWHLLNSLLLEICKIWELGPFWLTILQHLLECNT